MLKGKKIIIGTTGGIAAYKIPLLVRDLKKTGADVKVVMTDAAKEFVSPLTLATLSEHDVIVGTFPSETGGIQKGSTWHISLAQLADLMLIAPATANTIAKLTHGYADNAVSTLALSLRCPLMIAPAMDADMWLHTATQENVSKLREFGYIIIPPETGELASGLVGPGRLPEIATILRTIEWVLRKNYRDLGGKKILVTAGPTHEAIDPVRYIGNH